MMASHITLLLLLNPLVSSIDFTAGFFGSSVYHPNLQYYEVIDSSAFSHSIVKRGATESTNRFNKIKEIEFSALGRAFRLILNPRQGLLHPQFKAYSVDGSGNERIINVDHENFYEGRVFGEKDSDVSAHWEDGVMTATIRTPDDTFHVEPSWRHFPNGKNESMIVYRGSDVKHSWEDQHPDHKGQKMCDFVKVEGNATVADDEDLWPKEEDNLIDNDISNAISNEAKRRAKRQYASDDPIMSRKTRCSLLLVADYHFFQEMGGGNYKTTVNYLISLIDRVDKIYENTDWLDFGDNNGLGFVIEKILVHPEPTPVKFKGEHYNMKRDTWDVRNLLEVFSRESSHKKYCLAHLFTDSKFDGGVLGLAYVGSPRSNSVGGICTPDYFKNGRSLYLNAGLSSSRNHYGKKVITREADIVTAHEFGHNWGSEHDPDIPECSPSARHGGSFIMYTYSVSGYDINNKNFSPCSRRSVRKVLLAKSDKCFIAPPDSYCGNQRVEDDEECDAGLAGIDDIDPCCDKYCKLRVGSVCSDRNSPCCSRCQYMGHGMKCQEKQPATCENESRCLGAKAECPKPKPMPDGTPCIEKGECRQGKCLPFCETHGKQSCMCDTDKDACHRCCRDSFNSTCSPVDSEDILPNGTPCYHGFCNEGKCQKTVQDVVERFWNVIEHIDIDTVKMFIRDNIVGTVIIISVIIWIPASCIFALVDRKRQEEYRKECEKFREFAERWQRASLRHGFPRPKLRKPGFGDVVDEASKQLLQATIHA